MKRQFQSVSTFLANGQVEICSGLPAIEDALGFEPGRWHGTMTVKQNADATFVPDTPRAITPPSVDDVLKEQNLMIKRTSRNFIVTMKFPIIENADVTTQSHKDMWNKSKKAIASVRETIKNSF